jgi:hypothetical protein
MTTTSDNFDELLARVAEGRLDDLTPEQVAALAAHLDATPMAAQRLADIVAVTDPRLAGAPPSPPEAEWGRVWQGIDSAAATHASRPRGSTRALRLWQAVTAVAACLLLVVLWRSVNPPTEASWQMRLSDDVVVHEVEVFGDASSFIAYSEDGSGSAVIWVLEEDEQEQGA